MSAEGIHDLMGDNGLEQVSCSTERTRSGGRIYEGVFQKVARG